MDFITPQQACDLKAKFEKNERELRQVFIDKCRAQVDRVVPIINDRIQERAANGFGDAKITIGGLFPDIADEDAHIVLSFIGEELSKIGFNVVVNPLQGFVPANLVVSWSPVVATPKSKGASKNGQSTYSKVVWRR